MEEAFYLTPQFWVALSLFAFLAAAGRPLLRFITMSLDKRGLQIAADLQAARALREEAQQILEACQHKHNDALEETKLLIACAETEAKAMADKAETELKSALDKRMKLSMERIAQAEAKALNDIQNHVVDIAMAASRTLIQEHLTKSGNEALVKQAASELLRKLH